MGRIRKIKNADILIQRSSWLVKKDKGVCFEHDNPLEIEIGCGKGNFLIAKSLLNPQINYLGIERDATIILKLFNKMQRNNYLPKNLLVLHTDASNLMDWLQLNSIVTIYLNFPDPWPKKRNEKNRLTSPKFLDIYHSLLAKNGQMEFKTDNLPFFEYSLNEIKKNQGFKISLQTNDLYNDETLMVDNIPSEYEEKFRQQGKKINKIKFVKSNK
ncbi:MAG: tRNA (guanosine(46)-N7)-methyltransferase TrmB [Mycoplasmataceae bacterium]|jgi:tRNA (guanine-N7-)-methyltransferase|nr:tRNA (guanosine(46)-N7)-methyltransferase TrmB [Mycoplasmataceae bacterium]